MSPSRRLPLMQAALVAAALLHVPALCAQTDTQRIFRLVTPSVVTVLAFDESGGVEGQGSGVVIGAGRVATNCHLVRDARNLKVRSAKSENAATWTTQDPSRDLCVLTVAGLDAPAVRIRPYKELVVGERVFAVGNPLGFELSVSEGLVSALAPVRGEPALITSAAQSPGSSGGGLFDGDGRLVGITTGIMSLGQNFNLALPAEWIDAVSTRGLPAQPPAAAPEPEPRWRDHAEALRTKRDWPALEAFSRKWLATHPTSSKAGYFLGVTLVQMDRKEEAERVMRSAVGNDERDAVAWAYLGNVLHGSGNKVEATQALDRAIALRTGEAYFHLLQATWLRLEKRFDEARAAIDRAIAYGPGDSENWLELGLIETERQNVQAAARAFRAALRVDPNYVQARQMLAIVLARDGKADQAREVLGPEGLPAGVATGGAASDTWMAVGTSELAANRFADAENAFRKVIAGAPDSYRAWLSLGYVLARTGRAPEAEDAFARAVKIKPDFGAAFLALGTAQQRRGDGSAAIASFKRATETEPANPEAWRALAVASYAIREFRDSTAAFRRLIELGKAGGADFAQLGDGLIRTGQADAAREAMMVAEKLAPDDPTVLLGQAALAGLKGDYQRALEYAERVSAKDPANVAAWSTKGYTLMRLGRLPESVSALETAVGLDQSVANSWINLGEAQLRSREFGKAIRALERGATLAPNSTDVHMFLAQAYFSVKQMIKARQEAQFLLGRMPEFPPALALLTLASVIEGKSDEALASFKRLKARDPAMAATVRKQMIDLGTPASALPE